MLLQSHASNLLMVSQQAITGLFYAFDGWFNLAIGVEQLAHRIPCLSQTDWWIGPLFPGRIPYIISQAGFSLDRQAEMMFAARELFLSFSLFWLLSSHSERYLTRDLHPSPLNRFLLPESAVPWKRRAEGKRRLKLHFSDCIQQSNERKKLPQESSICNPRTLHGKAVFTRIKESYSDTLRGKCFDVRNRDVGRTGQSALPRCRY